ncbi:TrbI/VirB10 family protein, partial [Salmonella enterica]|nr:TrbI/VirB10 family protein [Salmonella enterica]EAZ7166797.1 TrbI/VirB10 family protein [Salmonella enterica]
QSYEDAKDKSGDPADPSYEANLYRSRFRENTDLQTPPATPDKAPSATGTIQTANVSQPQSNNTQTQSQERDQFAENVLRMKQQAYMEALNSKTTVRVDALSDNNSPPRGSSAPDYASIAEQLAAASKEENGELYANMQQNKEKFVNTERTFGYSTQTREAALSQTEIKAGMILPAVLVTEINSDLPGLITAQITEDVRDSLTGRKILIPRGSKLIGSYDSQVAMGQERVLVVWNRVQFPDTSTLALGNMGGTDGMGQSGFNDEVNNHYLRIFGNATLLAIIGAGFQLSQPDNNSNNGNNGMTAREQMIAEIGRQWSTVGTEVVRRNLNIQPTLHIRAGYKFNVLVNKDIILPEYQPNH